MAQALNIKNGLVYQIGSDTLQFNTADVTAAIGTTMTIGGVASPLVNLDIAVGPAVTAINIGTNAADKTITIGSTDDEIIIGGNLTVNGTEHVIGGTTFDDTVVLGDAQGDAITVNGTMSWTGGGSGGRVGSDIPFTAGDKNLLITGTTGGDLTFGAGNNSGGEGGDVRLIPGTGSTTDGNVVFGVNTAGTIDGYQILANTGDVAPAGLRYDDLNNKWQLRIDSGPWTDIAAGGSMPSGTVDQLAQCVSGTSWTAISDVYMKWEAATTRYLSVRTPTAADTNGGSITLVGGTATGTGAAGHTYVSGAATSGSGVAGNVIIAAGQSTSTGTTGEVRIYGGYAYAGTVNGGDVDICGGESIGGARGVVRLFWDIALQDGGTDYARVDLSSNGLTYSGTGYTTGTRFYDSDGYGMIWQYRGEGWEIAQESFTGTGGPMTLRGGHGTTAGGTGYLKGGNATVGGKGGTADIAAGSSIDAAGGDISISASAGNGTDQAGGDVTITAGAATGAGAGGTITFAPGASPTGLTGYLFYDGVASSETGFHFIYGTDAAVTHAGIRYSDATVGVNQDKWQVRFDDDATWYDILTSATSASVQPGDHVDEVLQWSGTDWENRKDITLREGDGTRTIKVQTSTTGAGETLSLLSGAPLGGSAAGSGSLTIGTPAPDGIGNSGLLSLSTGNVTTGIAGNINIYPGDATGAGTGGNINMEPGATLGGTAGYIHISRNVRFEADGVVRSARIDLASGDTTFSNGGYTAGTRFYDNDAFGMIWVARTEGWTITQETAGVGANGGGMTLQGGDGPTAGGNARLIGGAATVGGAGGEVSITAGAPIDAAGANVNITASAGNGTDRAGGDIIITAGAASGTATGGDIVLHMGAPAGLGVYGVIEIGPATPAASTSAYQIICNTDASPEAGLRYNNSDDSWEIRFDGNANWYDILTTNSSTSGIIPVTWGGTVAAKDVVYIASGPQAVEAISSGTIQQSRGIGVATTSGFVQVVGVATVVCVDAVAAAGVPVYVAPVANLGEVTTAVPTSGFITQVGIALGTCLAGGDLQILLQTAPPIGL